MSARPEVTIQGVNALMDALAHNVQLAFPGIGRETALKYLILMAQVMRDSEPGAATWFAFQDALQDAENRREPWAVDLLLALKSTEMSEG